jgi:hypothetical protein
LPERTTSLTKPAGSMRSSVLWFAAFLFLAGSLGGRASAQSASDAVTSSAIQAAFDAVREQREQRQAMLRHAAPDPSSPIVADETPPPPVSESNASKPQFLGDRLTYEADLSTMFAGGNTRQNFAELPGGMDASLLYKITRTTRAYAGYYQFSAQSLGNDDITPIVFQGTTTPIAYANLQAMRVDATTHLRFQLYNLQQMFTIGGWHHPLVIAPTYLATRSSIGGTDDTGTIFANNSILTNVHQRSYQNKSINLAIPLFYGEKYFIAYTGGLIWNNNLNGANVTNHPQYIQAGYASYQPSEDTTFFMNFVNVVTYFPTEVYPYKVPTFHYGVSKIIKKPFFLEAEVSTGGPSNPNYTNGISRVGVVDLTVPCAATATGHAPNLACVAAAGNGIAIPVVGGQRYTTFSLMLGIGAPPLVRPF